jgi:plasmid stabilization system protein ParE
MEITRIYWKKEALNNLKDILVSYYRRQGKSVTKRIIEKVTKNIETLKERPYLGYVEVSMSDQPQKIYSHFVSNKKIRVLYYTENDTLYVIDFCDD